MFKGTKTHIMSDNDVNIQDPLTLIGLWNWKLDTISVYYKVFWQTWCVSYEKMLLPGTKL